MVSRKSSTSRRTFLKGSAAGLMVAASSRYAVPMVNAQDKSPVTAWVTHSDDDLKSIQGIVAAFNEQSTTTEVKLEQVPGSETDSAKLITAVRGGTGPDAYMLDRFTVPERAAGGLLQDLSGPLEAVGFDPDLKNTYIEFAADEATFQGKPYALPFDADARGLFVNLDLITEAGGDPADFTLDAEPKVWDELAEMLVTLNKKNSAGDIFEVAGLVPWFDQGGGEYSWGFMWGANYFDKENCQVTPDDPKNIAAIQWVVDFANEYGVKALDAATTIAEGAPPQENPFLQGRVGVMYTGDWMLKTIERYVPDLNYDIIVPPVPEAGAASVSWAGGWSWVIPQNAKNVEGAAEFIAFAAGEPGQKLYTSETAHLPTVAALSGDSSLFDDRHAKYAEILLPLATNRPPLPVGAKYWDELNAGFEKARLGEASAEDAMAQAKKNTQQLLDPFCPVE